MVCEAVRSTTITHHRVAKIIFFSYFLNVDSNDRSNKYSTIVNYVQLTANF